MADRLHNFIASDADAGVRLDEFLAARLGELSRMRIARLVAEGACLVNGDVSVSGRRVSAGDRVAIDAYDAAPTAMNPEAIPLDVLFEDEHILVICKPSGMLVHPTRSVKSGTLANALAYHLNRDRIEQAKIACAAPEINDGGRPPFEEFSSGPMRRPGIIHRLDRATSGLLVTAKEPRSHSVLARHFRKKLIEKRYLALLDGVVENDTRLIEAPIGRVEDSKPYWRVLENGKAAETRLKVLERFAAATLVELEPVTGRTNQLRIHCALIGHSVLADEVYGPLLESTDNAPPRLFLHACRLAFHHPASGEWMEVTAPLPSELQTFLNQVRGVTPDLRAGREPDELPRS